MKENRGYVRVDVSAELDYKLKGSINTPVTVFLKDISAGGARFITSENLNQESTLQLTIRLGNFIKTGHAEGKVVWQRKISGYLFETGIQFIQITSEDKDSIQRFVDQKAGRSIERRRYVRCPLSTTIRYAQLSSPDNEQRGLSIDISGIGLEIITKERLGKGTQLKLSFNFPGETSPIVASGTVVWEKSGESSLFELGIEFTQLNEKDRDKICEYVKKTLILK